MTNRSGSPAKADRLHWLKFNPTEWAGMFPELDDEEYGLLHRVVARLWATPGNRLTLEDLCTELRIKSGDHRDECLQGLIGYALKTDEDGRLYVPALVEAFTDAIRRSNAGQQAAKTRWDKPEPTVTEGAGPTVPSAPQSPDF